MQQLCGRREKEAKLKDLEVEELKKRMEEQEHKYFALLRGQLVEEI